MKMVSTVMESHRRQSTDGIGPKIKRQMNDEPFIDACEKRAKKP
jgi:hypothetical protein